MRTNALVVLCASVTLAAGCAGGGESDDGFVTFYDGIGDGDGDESESGDGDGDATTTGDGDPTTTGDGDGDATTTGDGDGDATTTGDGDGDSTTGDGDGDIPIAPGNMIDDFEDGDGALIPSNGRQGYWYVFNDATVGGVQTPPADMVLPESGGAGGSSKAMHTSGSGFADWGAGIGVDFNNTGGIKMGWNASQFTGIVLMAKGSGQIRAAVQIEATVPTEEGGTCAANCDPHGKVLVLSGAWQQFTLPFNELTQEGWGTPAGWDSSKVVGLQLKVGKNTNFEFWIDQIGFY